MAKIRQKLPFFNPAEKNDHKMSLKKSGGWWEHGISLAIIWNCKPVSVKYSVYYPSEKHIYSSYPSKVENVRQGGEGPFVTQVGEIKPISLFFCF